MKVEKEPGLFQTRYVLTKKKEQSFFSFAVGLPNFVGWGKRKGRWGLLRWGGGKG